MLWLLAALTLSASPDPVHRIAIPGLNCANLDTKLANALVMHFAQQLTIHGGFAVTTADDVVQILGAERQKQLMACGDGADSCQAEIAAALGADVIVTGTVSKVGSAFLVNLKMLDSHNVSALGVYSGRPKSEDELLDLLETWATDFGNRYGAKPGAAPGAVATATASSAGTSSGSSTRPLAIAGLVGGGALVVGGSIAIILANLTAADVRKGNFTTSQAFNGAISTGRTEELAGYVLLGVGVAAAATGVVLLVTGSPSHVAVVPGPGGAVAVFSGEFP